MGKKPRKFQAQKSSSPNSFLSFFFSPRLCDHFSISSILPNPYILSESTWLLLSESVLPLSGLPSRSRCRPLPSMACAATLPLRPRYDALQIQLNFNGMLTWFDCLVPEGHLRRQPARRDREGQEAPQVCDAPFDSKSNS